MDARAALSWHRRALRQPVALRGLASELRAGVPSPLVAGALVAAADESDAHAAGRATAGTLLRILTALVNDHPVLLEQWTEQGVFGDSTPDQELRAAYSATLDRHLVNSNASVQPVTVLSVARLDTNNSATLLTRDRDGERDCQGFDLDWLKGGLRLTA